MVLLQPENEHLDCTKMLAILNAIRTFKDAN